MTEPRRGTSISDFRDHPRRDFPPDRRDSQIRRSRWDDRGSYGPRGRDGREDQRDDGDRWRGRDNIRREPFNDRAVSPPRRRDRSQPRPTLTRVASTPLTNPTEPQPTLQIQESTGIASVRDPRRRPADLLPVDENHTGGRAKAPVQNGHPEPIGNLATDINPSQNMVDAAKLKLIEGFTLSLLEILEAASSAGSLKYQKNLAEKKLACWQGNESNGEDGSMDTLAIFAAEQKKFVELEIKNLDSELQKVDETQKSASIKLANIMLVSVARGGEQISSHDELRQVKEELESHRKKVDLLSTMPNIVSETARMQQNLEIKFKSLETSSEASKTDDNTTRPIQSQLDLANIKSDIAQLDEKVRTLSNKLGESSSSPPWESNISKLKQEIDSLRAKLESRPSGPEPLEHTGAQADVQNTADTKMTDLTSEVDRLHQAQDAMATIIDREIRDVRSLISACRTDIQDNRTKLFELSAEVKYSESHAQPATQIDQSRSAIDDQKEKIKDIETKMHLLTENGKQIDLMKSQVSHHGAQIRDLGMSLEDQKLKVGDHQSEVTKMRQLLENHTKVMQHFDFYFHNLDGFRNGVMKDIEDLQLRYNSLRPATPVARSQQLWQQQQQPQMAQSAPVRMPQQQQIPPVATGQTPQQPAATPPVSVQMTRPPSATSSVPNQMSSAPPGPVQMSRPPSGEPPASAPMSRPPLEAPPASVPMSRPPSGGPPTSVPMSRPPSGPPPVPVSSSQLPVTLHTPAQMPQQQQVIQPPPVHIPQKNGVPIENDLTRIQDTLKICSSQIQALVAGLSNLDKRFNNMTTEHVVRQMVQQLHHIFPHAKNAELEIQNMKQRLESLDLEGFATITKSMSHFKELQETVAEIKLQFKELQEAYSIFKETTGSNVKLEELAISVEDIESKLTNKTEQDERNVEYMKETKSKFESELLSLKNIITTTSHDLTNRLDRMVESHNSDVKQLQNDMETLSQRSISSKGPPQQSSSKESGKKIPSNGSTPLLVSTKSITQTSKKVADKESSSSSNRASTALASSPTNSSMTKTFLTKRKRKAGYPTDSTSSNSDEDILQKHPRRR